MSNTFEKGKIYLSDTDGEDSICSHMPNNTFINCDDSEVYEYVSHEDLQELLPYGCGEMECIYMLKTVSISIKVKVTVSKMGVRSLADKIKDNKNDEG